MTMMMISISSIMLIVILWAIQASNGSVVIVGAGAAGIAAATKLLENNFNDVVVLEAERRIGGRIRSLKFGEAFVDLGAEWCYGIEGNVVYDLLKDLNVLEPSSLDNLRFYYSMGETVDEELNNKLWQILVQTCSFECNLSRNDGVTMAEYCEEKYNAAVSDLRLDDPKKLKFASDVLNYFKLFVQAMTQSHSWSSPSAQCDYVLCAGHPAINFGASGFKTVLDVMAMKSPQLADKIFLNKEVTRIIWDENPAGGVTVTCTDGTEYNADHVIFTPSLGVLKNNHATMFQPKLPAAKTAAVEALGFDSIAKVMLRFNDDWWRQEGFTGFNMVWSDELEKNMAWTRELVGFFPPPQNPRVLSAWFTGDHVEEIEGLTDEILLEGIKYVLDVFLGRLYNVSQPYDFIRSWWHTNPHFRGTASFQTLASRKLKSNEGLARPLRNTQGDLTLLFAGEATHQRYYASVHGAIETGYREAKRLLKLYK